MRNKNLAKETIDWWWLSSPCLCNLSLRHTEISSLITDYYIINEMLYGLACVALTDVMLVALFIATSRGGIRIRSLMHSFFIICYSRHMWFFKKLFPLKCSSCLSSANFVPLPKKRTVQFDLTKMQNAVFDFIRLLQSSDSVLNSIRLHWNFFRFSSIILQELNWLIVILDKNESTTFNKVNYVFLGNV